MPWVATGTQDAEGRPHWRCHTGRHKLRGHKPGGGCPCEVKPADYAAIDPKCPHRGQPLAKHGCCGSPTVIIYACPVVVACTLELDATLEWQGKPVHACLGCEFNPLRRAES